MMIVVLDQGESLGERHARNEDRPDPMMNHPAGNGNGLTVVESVQARDDDLPGAELRHVGVALRLGEAIHPEEWLRISGRVIER